MAQLPSTPYIHVTWQTCLGNPRQQSNPGIFNLETHIDYTGQMFYERFQNLDLDKAELEVFKLFFWIPLFFLSIGVRFESAFVFSKYQ
ncbi:hypothetical protein ACN42_g11375 [Penicillium freii]|uniref:Uncharacterized protein n=1 Tax=Penicillium freii TaxID=48697 RepID=A0A101M8A1_PENFR|nr:hypothetical protein ACN42_g11375 [Penicillium freii]